MGFNSGFKVLIAQKNAVLIIFSTYFVGEIKSVNFVELKLTDLCTLFVAYYKIAV